MKALAILVLLCGTARAEPFGWAGGVGWLHYEASEVHDIADTRGAPPVHDLVLAGARLHGLLGGRHGRFAYHIGLDLLAGGTIDRGAFAYDVALLPLGVAMRLGETSFVALGAGIGAMGAPGVVSGALTLPLQLDVELGRATRVIARGRIYTVERASRDSGSPSAPFGDELEAMLGLRLGTAYHGYGFPTGNGYFVAGAYRELYGARFVGLTIGYSIDAATPRSHGVGFDSRDDDD